MTDGERFARGGLIGSGRTTLRLVPHADPGALDEMSYDEGIYCPRCQSVVPALVWACGRHRCGGDGSGSGHLHSLILDMPDEILQAWAAVEKEPGWCPTCRNGVGLGEVPYRCTACGQAPDEYWHP